jgi:hypothetical protein
LTVIDGREAIVEEIAATTELRPYIVEQFRTLLGTSAFVDALPGYLLPGALLAKAVCQFCKRESKK